MRHYQIVEAKRCFSEILERVEGGELVLIVRGKEHEAVAGWVEVCWRRGGWFS